MVKINYLFILIIRCLSGLTNGDILVFLNRDDRSLLTSFDSVDFQSYTHLFRSSILSVEGIGGYCRDPIEGDVLAASLNLEREFFYQCRFDGLCA